METSTTIYPGSTIKLNSDILINLNPTHNGALNFDFKIDLICNIGETELNLLKFPIYLLFESNGNLNQNSFLEIWEMVEDIYNFNISANNLYSNTRIRDIFGMNNVFIVAEREIENNVYFCLF